MSNKHQMKTVVRTILRNVAHKLDHAILDLRKNQALGILLPGHLLSIFENLLINCVIDVGANKGNYAAALRHFGYKGRIVSIEPVSSVYAELARRASGDNAWHTLNLALGRKNETQNLNVFLAHDLSSFLTPSQNMSPNILNANLTHVERVTVKELDSVFSEIIEGIAEPRVFLKMDTQGYDLEVMKGASKSLSYVLGLQSEISVIPLYEGMPDYLEALSYYRKNGFEPTGFFTVGNDRKTGHVLEFDAVFTRRQPSEAAAQVSQD